MNVQYERMTAGGWGNTECPDGYSTLRTGAYMEFRVQIQGVSVIESVQSEVRGSAMRCVKKGVESMTCAVHRPKWRSAAGDEDASGRVWTAGRIGREGRRTSSITVSGPSRRGVVQS